MFKSSSPRLPSDIHRGSSYILVSTHLSEGALLLVDLLNHGRLAFNGNAGREHANLSMILPAPFLKSAMPSGPWRCRRSISCADDVADLDLPFSTMSHGSRAAL